MNPKKNISDAEMREILINMIKIEFGNYAVSLYKKFYTEEPIDIIVISANELFSELMGEAKAKEKLAPIWEKFKIKYEK